MKPRIVFCLLFLCFAVVLITGSARDKGTMIQVTGRVRLVGSDPLPDLVITGKDREWYVVKNEEYKLKDLQQRIVTVEGLETVQKQTFASGLPAKDRYILKNIKIISVE